jgi:hypothetical protein
MQLLSIERKIEDADLEAIARVHDYQTILKNQINPNFGQKDEPKFIDIPNPESEIDFALRFLTEKIDGVIVHEVTYPTILEGDIKINEVEQLKEDTGAFIKS